MRRKGVFKFQVTLLLDDYWLIFPSAMSMIAQT